MESSMDTDCREGSHRGLRHFLPLLAIPLAFGLAHRVARRKFGFNHMYRREEWRNGVPPMFAELHRRAHAAEAQEQAGTPA